MSVVSIGDLLIKFLETDSTVNGLVNTRIWPLRLPQKPELPAVVVQRISGVRIGQLNGNASAAEPRYQIDAWGKTVKDALAVGAAVRRCLEAYVGEWTDGESPEIRARVAVQFITERDQFEDDILGGLCRHSADYFVFHSTVGGVL